MKKRYWMALVLAGAVAAGLWLRRRRNGQPTHRVASLVAGAYAKIVQLWTGDDADLRRRLVDWAGVKPGDSVLDIDRGATGTAIAAARAVGPDGEVIRIVSSSRALDAALEQTKGLDLPVTFRNASPTDLPFTSARFGTITATMMWHHLSRSQRKSVISEAGRVLRLGGRLLVADLFPVSEHPIVVSRCFRVLKKEHLRHGPWVIFALLAERITKTPPKNPPREETAA